MAQWFASNDRILLTRAGAERLAESVSDLVPDPDAADQWLVVIVGTPDDLKKLMPGFGEKDYRACLGCSNMKIYEGSTSADGFSGVACRSLCSDSFFEARRLQLEAKLQAAAAAE